MLKLLKNFNKKDYLLMIICVLLITFHVWLELKMPDYMSEITILVQTEGSKMSEILTNGGYMLLCAFGSLVTAVTVGYFASFLSSTFSKNVRRQLFNKVEDMSMGDVKLFSINSLITRTTNDVTQIEMVIAMGLQMMIKAPIMAIWAISKILNKSFEWSMLTAFAVLILLTVITILTIIVIPKFKIVQKLTDKINGVTRENLTGIRVVRAFNAENYQEEKFEEVNDKLTKQQLFNQKSFAIMSPIMYMVMNFLSLFIYFIGADLISQSTLAGKLTLFGDMIVFSSYAMQVIMSFLMLAFVFMMIPRAGVSAKRINEVLDTEISIKDGSIDDVIPNKNSDNVIEFKNVYFKYPDAEEYLLEDISFVAKKGETVAFIGSTGSGKSTLINLVPRFYDATDGEILINGVNVKDYKLECLYKKIGYVPQKAVIFNDSVINNVNYGDNNQTLDNVKKAIEVAQGKEFVEKMDEGYESHLSSGGTNISGGQKQRIAIARSIARNPEIYIFDDSFSALDYKTDAILRKELKKHTDDATTLIVAQRIGTIMNADKIMVLDNGKCIGIGTHKQLLKNCEVYKQIALSQLSKEELENE